MISALLPTLVEAALRALVLALTVWAGLRMLRVRNVLAQKAAWGLVLVAALAMPLAQRWQGLTALAAIRLPAQTWGQAADLQQLGTDAAAAGQAAEKLRILGEMGGERPSAAKADVDSVGFMRGLKPPPPSGSRSSAVGGDRFPGPVVSQPNYASPALAARESATFTGAVAAPAGAVRRLFRLATYAWVLYLTVCAALLLRLLYGLGAAVRLWRAAEPVSLAWGDRLAAGLRLRSSRKVSSPVTIGSGILLPADYAEWDAEKLRIVLAHERSHIRQGDFYLQLLAGLHATVFWFSPLGWWLQRKLSELGEAISDRAGLEEAASRSSYAQILLEFAALPRPTLIGVAMARSSNVSHRIERLLNDSRFRQAFAGSRGRVLLAILLVPVALFAATAFIRVEAAGAARPVTPIQAAVPAPAQAPTTGQSTPDQAPPAEAPAPQSAPAPQEPASPAAPPPPSGQGSTVIPSGAPAPPPPPEPPNDDEATAGSGQSVTITHNRSNHIVTSQVNGQGRGYSYRWSSNGDSYAVVTAPGEVNFSGNWTGSRAEELKKASRLAHGKFLWFTRNGKSYIVEDPALLAQIEAMYKPMEALGRQQEELGRRQEELGKQQEKLGRDQEQANIPTPDLTKEMAELNAAMAKLQAKKGSTVSQEELADLESKLGEMQGRLGDIQGKIGAQQGKIGELQGKLGEQQGKLGAEQGRLGAEQGRLAMEADRKVKSIIDQCLRDGKARLVE